MYRVEQQPNGLFGVINDSRFDRVIDEETGQVEIRPQKVAWSMTEREALAWADRLSLREAWGI